MPPFFIPTRQSGDIFDHLHANLHFQFEDLLQIRIGWADLPCVQIFPYLLNNPQTGVMSRMEVVW